MKSFYEWVTEDTKEEEIQKEEILELLNDLLETAETDLEEDLIDFIISMIEIDAIESSAYDGIIDMVNDLIEDYDDSEDDEDEEEVDEAQRPLYKRKGYVKDPRTGRIRKRGNLGKPLDRKRSRLMKKARKKHKRSYKMAQRKTRKTKKRLGQIK